MAQPITSTGYDGTVDEVDWASLSPASSSRPGVIDTGFAATIVGNVDRTIRVNPGQAYGWGVLDTLTGTVDLQADPVTSGSRWDTLVLRRDWQPTPGGGSTLMLLKGSSTKARSALRQSNAGVLADQVLGILRVQAGLTTIQEWVDLREWQSSLSFRYDAGIPTASTWAYGDKIVQSAGDNRGLDLAVRRGGTGSEVWDWMLSRPMTDLSLASGYRANGGRTPQWRVVGDMLHLDGAVEKTNGATFSNIWTTIGSVPASVAPNRDKFFPIGGSFSSDTGGGGQMNVQSNGVIQVAAPKSLATWLSLDNIQIYIGG